MLKFIEAINNTVKLITSLATLAILGGVVFGGLWVYHKAAELTSTPFTVPKIVIPMPEIKLPEKITLPEVKVNLPDIGIVEGIKKFDRELGRAADNLTKPKEDDDEVVGEWGFLTRRALSDPTPVPHTSDGRPCDHTPRCENSFDYREKHPIETCDHSPKCTDAVEYLIHMYVSIFRTCTHAPRCTVPSQHYDKMRSSSLSLSKE